MHSCSARSISIRAIRVRARQRPERRLILLGAAGLAFALFNSLVIGTASVLPLILFDLAAFAGAAVIGLYVWRTHEIDLDRETVYTEIDLALYCAKHAGRNRVVSIEAADESG